MNLSPLLIESKTASEFLKRVEMTLKNSEAGFSYADFARRAGFSARSYVREVFQGKKALTLKALPAFAKALGMKKEERELFRCLIAIENPQFDPTVSPENAKKSLQVKNETLKRRLARGRVGASLSSLSRIESWPRVYVALGNGREFPEIQAATKLTTLHLERTLKEMAEAKLIRCRGDRYEPTSPHLVLDPSIHSEMIASHFQAVLTDAIDGSKMNFRDPEKLYFVSSFGVRKDRLPELKAKLIETLLRFVDDSEDSQNEEIVSLATTLI